MGRQSPILLALLLATPTTVSTANVVTDWDATAVGIVQTGTAPPPPLGFRTMAILHTAMFDAVNSIEPRYQTAQSPACGDAGHVQGSSGGSCRGSGADQAVS